MALDTGATLATLHVAAFVAAPGLGIVDAECLAMASDLALTNISIGGCDLDAIARTGCDSLVHRADEGGPAVGIDSVVTEVIGDIHTL